MRVLTTILMVSLGMLALPRPAQADSLKWFLDAYTEGQTNLERQMVNHGPEADAALWPIYVSTVSTFARLAPHSIKEATDTDILIATHTELVMTLVTLEQMILGPKRFLYEDYAEELDEASIHVETAIYEVNKQFVALGGDKGDLEILKIKPSPIIERFEKDLLDQQ